MESVFILWYWWPNEVESDDSMLLGVYSSREIAEERIERKYKSLPGFHNSDGDFTIDEYPINKDHWEEGFVETS